jgi:hypothetical protein
MEYEAASCHTYDMNYELEFRAWCPLLIGFFYELVKMNADNERIFLVCETTGERLVNLYGRPFVISFVGRDGKEVVQIQPGTTSEVS